MLLSLVALLLLLVHAAPPAMAGTDAAPPDAAPPDSSATVCRFSGRVAVRTPAPGALAAYRDDPAFQYEAARMGRSWWARLRRWLWETLLEPVMGPLGKWNRPLMYALLGAALVFAFVQFARMRSGGAWRPPARRTGASFAEIEDHLRETDLSALVDEAARAGHYRRAVRLLYLRVLRALADAGRIAWDPAKTNRTYVRELAAATPGDRASADADTAPDELAALTRLFERVWYGHADVTKGTFERLRPRFERFRRRVEGVGERERGRKGERKKGERGSMEERAAGAPA